MKPLMLAWLLVLIACTTTHAVYVSNGTGGRAGVKRHIEAEANVKIDSEINGVKHGQ